MSDTSTTLSGTTSEPCGSEHEDVVELHWMKTPNLDMHEEYGVSAQALCGKWIEPEDPLGADTGDPTSGSERYVSCSRCDALHALHVSAVEAAC